MRAVPLVVSGIALSMVLVACGGNTTRPDTQNNTAVNTATSVAGTIHVQQYTPYVETSLVDMAVKQECRIDQQLPQFINTYASEHGMSVQLDPVVEADNKGNNLVVKIVQAQSNGNAFIGHRKYTKIQAVLYQDGKEIADLTAARASGGGFFGGYKSSCSVMGRTVKALGQDVALWLKAPGPGMRKGNL